LIRGGQELSSYPEWCTLQLERRTVTGEDDASIERELEYVLAQLRLADHDFQATQKVTAYRPAYRLDPQHALPAAVGRALANAGQSPEPTGMSFWTDAAILAGAGMPSILFGPGGAGLHSTVEYVNVQDVLVCRDVLVGATRALIS